MRFGDLPSGFFRLPNTGPRGPVFLKLLSLPGDVAGHRNAVDVSDHLGARLGIDDNTEVIPVTAVDHRWRTSG